MIRGNINRRQPTHLLAKQTLVMWSHQRTKISLATAQARAAQHNAQLLVAISFIVHCTSIAWAAPENIVQGPTPAVPRQWQQCQALQDDPDARLQCFDRWAAQQGGATQANTAPIAPPTHQQAPVVITMQAPTVHDCKNPRFSELSRFWELEAGSDCGTFGLRGYRPISLSWIGSDSVNTQPSSPSLPNNASTSVPYRTVETRVGLSVRTKIARGLLTRDEPQKRDSIWFAYSQQSNWQIFSGDLSRPFRTTDHEPELIYIYPFDAALAWGWRLRYGGVSLNHQSNGQPLPFSRSWNRTILLAGMERGPNLTVQAKLWQRIPENASDDDNPDIDVRMGRAEVAGFWYADSNNTLGLTLRHALFNGNSGSFKLNGCASWVATTRPTTPAACAFTPNCSVAMATHWWTTTAAAPCSASA